ncbi:MAG: hypothetical protein U1A78_17660 [Polyangia bacterium]
MAILFSDEPVEAVDSLIALSDGRLARLDGIPALKIVVRAYWDRARVAVISGGSGHTPAHRLRRRGDTHRGGLRLDLCIAQRRRFRRSEHGRLLQRTGPWGAALARKFLLQLPWREASGQELVSRAQDQTSSLLILCEQAREQQLTVQRLLLRCIHPGAAQDVGVQGDRSRGQLWLSAREGAQVAQVEHAAHLQPRERKSKRYRLREYSARQRIVRVAAEQP